MAVVDTDLFQSYSVSVTNDYPQTYVCNVAADSFATVAADGYFDSLVNRVVTGDKLLVKTTTANLSFSGTFRNNGTNVFVDWDRTLWLQGTMADVSGANVVNIACPAGVVIQIGGVVDTVITGTSIVTANIGGTAMTGASLSFTTAQARVVATVTALNTYAAAGVIRFVSDGGSTNTAQCNLFAKMICPTQI